MPSTQPERYLVIAKDKDRNYYIGRVTEGYISNYFCWCNTDVPLEVGSLVDGCLSSGENGTMFLKVNVVNIRAKKQKNVIALSQHKTRQSDRDFIKNAKPASILQFGHFHIEQ